VQLNPLVGFYLRYSVVLHVHPYETRLAALDSSVLTGAWMRCCAADEAAAPGSLCGRCVHFSYRYETQLL
jgi:hypothetical protein